MKKDIYIENGFSITANELIAKIVNFINPKRNEMILDFGCGTGTLSLRIENKCQSIIGIDIEKNSLTHLDNKLKYKCLASSKLPFADNIFDKIICFHVLEHISYENQKPILKEFRRVLKSSGNLYVGVPIMEIQGRFLRNLRSLITSQHDIVDFFGSKDHKRKYTQKKLLAELNLYGFEQINYIQNIAIPDKFYYIWNLFGRLINKCPLIFDILYNFKIKN